MGQANKSHLARLYIAKLLQDGKPHSYSQMRSYVEQQSGLSYTTGQFSTILSRFIKNNSETYCQVKRGIYQCLVDVTAVLEDDNMACETNTKTMLSITNQEICSVEEFYESLKASILEVVIATDKCKKTTYNLQGSIIQACNGDPRIRRLFTLLDQLVDIAQTVEGDIKMIDS